LNPEAEVIDMRTGWIAALLVGLITYVVLKLLPTSIKGNDHALLAAAVAFVASVLVRYLPLRRW